jgi:hypothetical protein
MPRPIIPENWQEGTIEGYYLRTDDSRDIMGIKEEDIKDWIYIPEEDLLMGFTVDRAGISITSFNEDTAEARVVKKILKFDYGHSENLGRMDLPRPNVYRLISAGRALEEAKENFDISARSLIGALGGGSD